MEQPPKPRKIRWPSDLTRVYDRRSDPDKDSLKQARDTRQKLADGHYERADSIARRRAKYIEQTRQRDRNYDPELDWWH